MVLNRYPLWKNLLVIFIVVIAFFYAAPNLFGDDPAVQISSAKVTVKIDSNVLNTVNQILAKEQVNYKAAQFEDHSLLLRFASTDQQLKAKEALQAALGEDYVVAINLAPNTPSWLKSINALPMKLGLDLRGGVHFLLQVDVDTVLKQRIEGDLSSVSQALRAQRIRYSDIARQGAQGVTVKFRSNEEMDNAIKYLSAHFTEFTWTKNTIDDQFQVQGVLSPAALQQARQDTLEQTMNKLRNRVNELGVTEAVVQQQGATRVVIDLPGIQDTTQAKNILGKTATLEFRMVDTEHDARNAVGGMAPPDAKLFDFNGQPILLKNQIVLRGSSITNANSGYDDNGRPAVHVRVGGGGEDLFTKITSENIGKPMAIVYVEVKSVPKTVDGKETIEYTTERHIISTPVIQGPLGNQFDVTGLSSPEESRTLALLLRAGALPATITYLEERQVGPSLGEQNIHMGVTSVIVGFVLVVLFMALYYRGMGLIADLALGMNLILIVALLSLLGATVTLPGIAGIVLTMGMAVDANVLIFERIREEIRNGTGIQAAINAGYDRALITIIDANMTTLIVAVVLFSLGSGVVKNFAITLTIGLFTSMFTAIIGTRAIVNWLYGGKPVKKISIGI